MTLREVIDQYIAWRQVRGARFQSQAYALRRYSRGVGDAIGCDEVGSEWVVYSKPPFDGPARVLDYVGRYTHRVALSNDRIPAVEDGRVRFRWRDYRHGRRLRSMTLSAEEFIRRFLLHVLPRGFHRIRHCGFLASRRAPAPGRHVVIAARAPPDRSPRPAGPADRPGQLRPRIHSRPRSRRRPGGRGVPGPSASAPCPPRGVPVRPSCAASAAAGAPSSPCRPSNPHRQGIGRRFNPTHFLVTGAARGLLLSLPASVCRPADQKMLFIMSSTT